MNVANIFVNTDRSGNHLENYNSSDKIVLGKAHKKLWKLPSNQAVRGR